MASASVEKLFREYAAAFSKLDIENQVDHFADAFIMAGPKGAVSGSKEEFRKNAAQAVAFYKSVGQSSARLLSIEETPISKDYVIAKTHWAVTFDKNGDKPIEFDVSYILYTAPPEPKIMMSISHEDEQEAMAKLGVLKG